MNKEKTLLKYLKENSGYIKRKELNKLNITKEELNDYLKRKIIKKVAHGLYMDNKIFEDDLYIFQIKYPDIVYSYNTAFYILGVSEKIPSNYDVSIPSNKSIRCEYGFKIHRLKPELYELGLIETTTPCGNRVKIYDLERNICDIIKYNKEIEREITNKIINDSFKQNKINIDKLIEYAKKLNVYKEIMTLIGVLIQ